jgi:alcohol dehydrogenase (NADP+)
MTSNESYTFQGWMGLDKNSIGNMKWQTFDPKPWEENDVDIKITHSGICGSDLHTLKSGWVHPHIFSTRIIVERLTSFC